MARMKLDEVTGWQAEVEANEATKTYKPVVAVEGGAGGGSGSGSGGASGGVIAGVDANGTKWFAIINSTTTPPTISYANQATGAIGTPVGGFTPDADQNGLTNNELRTAPVDIEPAYAPSGRASITGVFTAAGQRSAAFTPIAGRAFNITRNGPGSANVRLVRSFDNGSTWHPITANGLAIMAFTAPFSEQWSDDEAGVAYSLECTAFTSGTVNYRISQ